MNLDHHPHPVGAGFSRRSSGNLMHYLLLLFLASMGVSPFVGSCGGILAAGNTKVTRHPNPSAPLADRWKWAHTEAGRQELTKGYWAGYSIQRLMGEHSTIGSVYSDPRRNRPTLSEIITGTEQLGDGNPSGWVDYGDNEGLINDDENQSPEHQVMKEVAILFHFADTRGNEPAKIRISNMQLHVELEGDPILWLGGASESESIGFLKEQYAMLHGKDVRKEIVTAIGLHSPSEATLSFLRDVLNSKDAPRVREQAAFWLGQMNTDEALAVLVHAANTDESDKIREEAVFGVSQMRGDRGLDALIKLTNEGSNREVQKKAAFWLGQRASEKAVAALKDAVYSSKDTEIQKSALFALTQNSSEDAVDDLIRIAKGHPNPKIRKEAIFWLSQKDNKKAREALIDIVRQ